MAKRRAIDVSDIPGLKRLAKELVESGETLVLRDRGIDLATISPEKPLSIRRQRLQEQKEADIESFKSSAGGWADVDVDEFFKYMYDARDRGVRPLQH